MRLWSTAHFLELKDPQCSLHRVFFQVNILMENCQKLLKLLLPSDVKQHLNTYTGSDSYFQPKRHAF